MMTQSDRAAEDAKFEAGRAEREAKQAEAAKKAEYAALDGEGMKAIREAISALSAGKNVPNSFIEYDGKIAAVKEKYEKKGQK